MILPTDASVLMGEVVIPVGKTHTLGDLELEAIEFGASGIAFFLGGERHGPAFAREGDLLFEASHGVDLTCSSLSEISRADPCPRVWQCALLRYLCLKTVNLVLCCGE